MEITKVDFKLHSIIMLVGPDNSGQTNFIFKLTQELKKSSSANKKISIVHVNMQEIYSELTGQDSPDLHSVECVQIKEQAVEIAMSKIKSFTSYIGKFLEKHKSLKVLALSFILMIGLFLILDAAHIDVPKGYIYVVIAFSLFVEVINIKFKHRK